MRRNSSKFYIYQSGFECDGFYADNITDICNKLFYLFGWFGKYDFLTAYESIERRINNTKTSNVLLDQNLGLKIMIL